MPTSVAGQAPIPLSARQGRDLQRYNGNGERLVAGCIPIRILSPEAGANGVEVCMVTSRGGKGLVFPKGGWETDETVEAAAMRETVEEAGVRGALEEQPLGVFPFYSGKAARVHNATNGGCIAYMFVMRVGEELATWPEQDQRQRIWCSVQEASDKLRHDWMKEALHTWVRRQGWSTQVITTCGQNHVGSTTSTSNGSIAAHS